MRSPRTRRTPRRTSGAPGIPGPLRVPPSRRIVPEARATGVRAPPRLCSPSMADDVVLVEASRARGPDHQPRQGLLRRARRDQARPRPLLPGGRGAAAARHGRPPGAAPALSQRRRRAVLLPEAGPGVAPGLAGDHDRQHPQRHHVAGAGRRRPGPRALGGQPGLPRLPRLAVAGGGPRARRRAAHRPRPDPRGHVRDGAGGGARGARAASTSSGVACLPKTTGNRGIHVYVRLQPRWTLVRGARGGGRRGPRARAAPPRPDHRGLVEGGARPPGLRRLQPERAAQDDLRGVVGAGPARGAGVDAVRLGRAGRRSPRTS